MVLCLALHLPWFCVCFDFCKRFGSSFSIFCRSLVWVFCFDFSQKVWVSSFCFNFFVECLGLCFNFLRNVWVFYFDLKKKSVIYSRFVADISVISTIYHRLSGDCFGDVFPLFTHVLQTQYDHDISNLGRYSRYLDDFILIDFTLPHISSYATVTYRYKRPLNCCIRSNATVWEPMHLNPLQKGIATV